ncbi:MAG: chemotaxis protein CheX [Epsilonproteobacteria bacterium]|nr:chemotaxis protein CheX [Campylobacterota bacterium]
MFDVKSKIATLEYNGKFSESKNKDTINSINKQIDSIGKDKINGIFISFKNLVYSDPKELAIFIKQLRSHKVYDTMIGIYDYDMQTYKILRTIIKNTNIKLFHNIDTIKLFLDPKSFKKTLPVLVFDENEENTKTLMHALSELGYSVTKADSKEEYEKLLRSEKYKFGVIQSFINGSLKPKTNNKPTLFLSKKLILNLPIFMDTAVEILVTYTGLKAQKISHKITTFNNDLQSDMVCALMKFKGDLSGSFILIFPKETAIKALEAMLAEKINPKDSEAIMDGVGEFCNSITGSTKTYLSQKNIKVLFELPRTYNSLNQLYTVINNSGIWINMQLDQKPFYMFIVS